MFKLLMEEAWRSLNSWKYRWWALYGLIALTVASSYHWIHKGLIDQSCLFIAVIGSVSLNLILLFGLWGLIADKWGKGRPKWQGWFILIVGLVIIIIIMNRGGGLETRFI